MIRKNQPQILKVGASTTLSSLKTSIIEYLTTDKIVILDSIGEKATYIALKAAIYSQRHLPENVLVNTRPGMVLIDTPDGERKAVRLTIELAS